MYPASVQYLYGAIITFIIYMSKWENSERQEDPSAPFQILLSQTNSAVTLMQNPQFLEKVKNNNTQFTQIITLISHRNILQEIIDIALNPIAYSKRSQCILNTTLTHCAIQILTNLSEEFTQFVFQQSSKNEEQSIQNISTIPIIDYIFSAALSEETEETGFANLLKLVTPLLYRRPQKMLHILNGDLIKKLMQYFGNKSVCELLTKAMEVEAEDNQFYQTLKLTLVQAIFHSIAQQHNQNRLLSLVQNVGQFLEDLAEKREDRYQKQKYHSFIKDIVTKVDQFQFLISILYNYPHDHLLKGEVLHCIQAYLRLHLPCKINQKQNHKTSNESNSEINKSITADQKFITRLKDSVQQLGLEAFLSEQRRQIVNYYKLIKNLITIEPQLTPSILTRQFIIHTFNIMQKDSDNNILHNFQKDVLIEAVSKSPEIYLLLKDQTGLQNLLRNNLTNTLSKTSYQIQLFLIGEAVKNKTEELHISSQNWKDLESTINNKRNFYSIKIAGGTHSFGQSKWDDFEGKHVKEQVIETYIGKDLFSVLQNKNNPSFTPKLDELGGAEVLSEQADKDQEQQQKNQHYFDFQLPFDSDKQQQKQINKETNKQETSISKKPLVQIVVDSQSQLIDQKQNEVPTNVSDEDKLKSSSQTQIKQIKTTEIKVSPTKNNRKVTFQSQKNTELTQQQYRILALLQQKTSLAQVMSSSQACSQNCEDENGLQEDGSYNKIGLLRGSMVDSQLYTSKGKDEVQPTNLIQFLQFIPQVPPAQSQQNNPITEEESVYSQQ